MPSDAYTAPAGPVINGNVRTQLSMPAEVGSSVELSANTNNSENVIVPITVEEITCATALPGLQLDYDTAQEVDAVADTGNQLCMVQLAVENTSNKPIFYTASGDEWTVLTSNGNQYSETNKVSPGIAARSAGVEWGADSNYVQPGNTEYEFVAFEIPADATPEEFLMLSWLPVDMD